LYLKFISRFKGCPCWVLSLKDADYLSDCVHRRDT
jgi:hypothetical protein